MICNATRIILLKTDDDLTYEIFFSKQISLLYFLSICLAILQLLKSYKYFIKLLTGNKYSAGDVTNFLRNVYASNLYKMLWFPLRLRQLNWLETYGCTPSLEYRIQHSENIFSVGYRYTLNIRSGSSRIRRT